MFGFMPFGSGEPAVIIQNTYLVAVGDNGISGTSKRFNLFGFDSPASYTALSDPDYVSGNPMTSGQFSPPGNYLVTVDNAGPTVSRPIVIYTHVDGTLTSLPSTCIDDYVVTYNSLKWAAFSPDEKWLCVCGSEAPYVWLYLRSGNTFTLQGNLLSTGSNSSCYCVAWSPDGQFLAVGWGIFQCKIFTVNNNDNTFTFKQYVGTYGCYFITWSSDSTRIAISGEGSNLAFMYKYNGSTFDSVTLNGLPGFGSTGTSPGLAISPDSNYLAIARSPSAFYILHKTSDLVYDFFQNPTGIIDGVSLTRPIWTPDGMSLICGGNGSTVESEDSSLVQYSFASTIDDDPMTDNFDVGSDIDLTGARRNGANFWYLFNQESMTTSISGGQLILDEPGGTYPLRGVTQNIIDNLMLGSEYKVKLTFSVVQATGKVTAGIALSNFGGSYAYYVYGLIRRYDGSAYTWKLTIDGWYSTTNYYGVLVETDIFTSSGYTPTDPIWLKIHRNNGSPNSNVIFSYSFDGTSFTTFFTDSSGFFNSPAISLVIANETSGHALAYFDDFQRTDRVGSLVRLYLPDIKTRSNIGGVSLITVNAV